MMRISSLQILKFLKRVKEKYGFIKRNTYKASESINKRWKLTRVESTPAQGMWAKGGLGTWDLMNNVCIAECKVFISVLVFIR